MMQAGVDYVPRCVVCGDVVRHRDLKLWSVAGFRLDRTCWKKIYGSKKTTGAEVEK